MKILHVIHTPRFSGAEMLVCSLTKRHANDGHQCCVVALNPPESAFLDTIAQLENLGVHWLYPEKALSKLGRIIFLRRAFLNFGADAIFMHSLIPAAYARIAGFGFKKNFVLHDANQNDHREIKYYLAELLLQFFTRAVVSVSELSNYNYGRRFFYPQKYVIQNGVDIDLFAYPSVNPLVYHKYGLNKDLRYIVQIGRFTAIKRQELSVSASVDILKRHQDICIIFAGERENMSVVDEVSRIADQNNVAGQVKFLGPIPREDVAELLSISSVYLMPSSMEAHSVAMIEALASGIAIVCSSIDSLKFASEYDGVFVVDPLDVPQYSNAIQCALNVDKRYIRDLSSFSIELTADRYIEIAAH